MADQAGPLNAAYDLPQMWLREYNRVKDSRTRIALAGQWRRQEVEPVVDIDGDSAEAFKITLPHSTTIGQDIVNFISRKGPSIRRTPNGSRGAASAGPRAQRLASKIEDFAQAVGTTVKSNGEPLWDAIDAHAVNDGEFGVLVTPRPAHWASLLDFRIEDGSGGIIIHPRFQRDAEGRSHDDLSDGAAFEVHTGKSTETYKTYAREAKAKCLPVVIQILGADMALPIGVDPTTGKVDGLLIKSHRSVSSLERDGFSWQVLGDPQSAESEVTTGDLTLTLYELHLPGKIVYQVADYAGLRRYQTQLKNADGDVGDAVIDMEAEYGLCEVPGGWFYGAHFASERDPNKRAYPFIWPFVRLFRGLSQSLTNVTVTGYLIASNAWLVDPSGVDENLWTENGQPIDVEIKPNRANVVPGRPTAAHPAGVGKEVGMFLEVGLQLLDQLAPSQAISGNTDDSGFGASVKMAAAQGSLSQLLNGCTAAYECAISWTLAIVSALSQKLGEPIPVAATVDRDGTVHAIHELSADDLEGDFSVEVLFPTKKGQNLPLAQAMFQWFKEGGISHYTWLQDGLGEEQPEKEQDRIWVEQRLRSPEGEAYVNELIGKYSGDHELTKIAALQQQGKVTPGGLPASVLPARPQGAALAGPMSGNPAQSAVAGMMSGQSMAGPMSQVLQAVGQAPETAVM